MEGSKLAQRGIDYGFSLFQKMWLLPMAFLAAGRLAHLAEKLAIEFVGN